MPDKPRTPAGYGQPPYPPPPHAGDNQPPRKRSNTWIIIVVLAVIGLPVVLVILGALGFFMLAASSEAPAPEVAETTAEADYAVHGEVMQFEQWDCIRVIDGDTIEVQHASDSGWVERVRLLGIDTPERDEPGYDEATKALEKLVLNRQVATQLDLKHDKRDSFGRVLAYVILMEPAVEGEPGTGGETVVNVEMVRLGHSVYWTDFGKSSMYDAEFRAASGD